MASIIFDFDGTLADTFPLIVDVSYKLSPRTKRLPEQKLRELRRLPLLVALLRLGIPWLYVPRLAMSTRSHLRDSMLDAEPFEGIPGMMQTLHAQGHRLFILSSNYPENIRLFLTHHRLGNCVSGIEGVYWATAWTKASALKAMIKKYKLNPRSCYHVGNETLDIKAANRAGIRGIAVTWSGYDIKALERAKPFAIVQSPKAIAGALAK